MAGSGGVELGCLLCGGVFGSGRYLLKNAIEQAEVEQKDANCDKGFVFRFHNDCRR